jgi:hypothetical protein
MLDHYVDDTEEELSLKSNRTFERLVGSFPLKVAKRYGYIPEREGAGVNDLLTAAIERQDWQGARELLEQLSNDGQRQ